MLQDMENTENGDSTASRGGPTPSPTDMSGASGAQAIPGAEAGRADGAGPGPRPEELPSSLPMPIPGEQLGTPPPLHLPLCAGPGRRGSLHTPSQRPHRVSYCHHIALVPGTADPDPHCNLYQLSLAFVHPVPVASHTSNTTVTYTSINFVHPCLVFCYPVPR